MRKAAITGRAVTRRAVRDIGLVEWARLVAEIKAADGVAEEVAVVRAKAFLRIAPRRLFDLDMRVRAGRA